MLKQPSLIDISKLVETFFALHCYFGVIVVYDSSLLLYESVPDHFSYATTERQRLRPWKIILKYPCTSIGINTADRKHL